MRGIQFRLPFQRQKGGSQPKGSATKQTDSNSAKPSSKKDLPPSEPGLERTESLRVPKFSNPTNRPEIKPVRHPITRPTPDTVPPKDFSPPPSGQKPRKFFGITLPFQKDRLRKQEEQRIKAGVDGKLMSLGRNAVTDDDMAHERMRKPEYMEIIRERHPKIDGYSPTAQSEAFANLLSHPEYAAAYAKMRNEKTALPSGPTATRQMTKDEQTFLTNAFHRLREDIANKPFHMHGETAITGNKKGEITQFNHTPAQHSLAVPGAGDKFHLHSHPPFGEPFTSSASAADHRLAARFLKDNDLTGTYVTNGKDVLHIQPNSTELVKLTPDPKVEKKLGEFPVAYELTKPQDPPYPFSNHEAPAEVKKWTPPPNWKRKDH